VHSSRPFKGLSAIETDDLRGRLRFMSERCYLVTFRQIDPFYVIDLGSPAEPRMLGYLKIPVSLATSTPTTMRTS